MHPGRPHPFALLLAVASVLALVAAIAAPDRAPAVALYWNPIYRAEIGLVVLALVYLLAVAGWMAWNGEAFRRIELPGGAAIERDFSELDAAASHFDLFTETTGERLDEMEWSLDKLLARVERLEAGPQGGGDRVP